MSTTTVDEIVEKVYVRKLFSFDHFGDISTVFTTCIIEYSIVGAAIMFVIWKNLDFHHESLSKKKKQINTEDCRLFLIILKISFKKFLVHQLADFLVAFY